MSTATETEVTLPLAAEAPPLRWDEAGRTYRFVDSRITLHHFLRRRAAGLSPEQLAEEMTTIELPDVYAVLAYCLRHPAEIAAYMRHCDEREAEAMARLIARQGPFKTREWFEAKLAAKQAQAQGE